MGCGIRISGLGSGVCSEPVAPPRELAHRPQKKKGVEGGGGGGGCLGRLTSILRVLFVFLDSSRKPLWDWVRCLTKEATKRRRSTQESRIDGMNFEETETTRSREGGWSILLGEGRGEHAWMCG